MIGRLFTSINVFALLAGPALAEPGTKYAYSNYGYCLLGRVIEIV